MSDGLARHLQRHLGEVVGEWSHGPDGDELPFTVVHFEPREGTATEVYCTLGLSDYELGEDEHRIELLMITPLALPEGSIPPVLVEVGAMPIEVGDVPELGDVFTDIAPLAEVSDMDTLYVGRPLYQPTGFAQYGSRFDGVDIFWLVPVHETEAEFVRAEGWEAFERLMWDLDVDPTDFSRGPWI